MPSGGINIARITNGIGNYQVLDTQVDINSSINALQIVSDETMLATGINPLAPFQDLGDEKL